MAGRAPCCPAEGLGLVAPGSSGCGTGAPDHGPPFRHTAHHPQPGEPTGRPADHTAGALAGRGAADGGEGAAQAGTGQSASTPVPPSATADEAEAPQHPAMSPHGAIGRAAALRMAAAAVVVAWDEPEHQGLEDAINALREALATAPRVQRDAFASASRAPAPSRRQCSPYCAATTALRWRRS